MTCETPSMCRPARSHVGRDEHGELAVLEVLEHAEPPVLGHVARERARRIAVRREPPHEVGRRRAPVDEDQDAAASLPFEKAEEEAELLRRRDVVQDLGDAAREHALGLDLDFFGVVRVLVGQLHDAHRQRRREEQRLPAVVRRAAPQDAPQVPDEAHVEHPVGLVDDEDLDVLERHHALLLVVEQAAGRADEQVGDRLDLLALEPIVHAAEDGEGGEARVAAEDLGVGPDLRHELARRRHDEGPRSPRLPGRRLAEQPREDRDQKGGGLAGPGLRLAGQVLAGEGERKRLRLDGRREDEARLGDAPADLVRQGIAREQRLGQVVLRGARGHGRGAILTQPQRTGCRRPAGTFSRH